MIELVYLFLFDTYQQCGLSAGLMAFIHIIFNMSVKPISVKQAERWLERLKSENPQSYKEISRSLRRYEKTQDDFDCYVKVNHALLPHPDLTRDLNQHLEEQHKMLINKSDEEKIKDLMAYTKKTNVEIFERIINMINELSKSKSQTSGEISKSLKPRLKEIVVGHKDLERITEEAVDLSNEELIARKNLEHLKSKLPPLQIEEEKQTKQQPQRPQTENRRPVEDSQTRQTGGRFSRPVLIGPFANPSEERGIFKQIQKMVDDQTYDYIIKVVKIFYLNIISRNQAFQLLGGVQVDELYMECLKEILDTRETQRRKVSVFRPLNDLNFSNAERASPSYVVIPPYYSVTSNAKPVWIRAITNESWVSVPYGSQESENFLVRNKNSNEINLLKAEDQRYEFDLYMRRMRKTLTFLEILVDQANPKSEHEREKLIQSVLGLGTLQTIYKNSHREQKEEMEWFLRIADLETCKVFKERVLGQINELTNIKDIHAIKNWNQVASKNFFKALDLKGFEFKKNEKDKMKGTFFITELQERQKLLESGGQNKNGALFQQKKEFFTILNSFQSSSRTQKCTSRTLPPIQTFDLKEEHTRHLYPTVIMAFENETICKNIYSLLLFYIDAFPMTEPEKIRCKYFLEQFLVGFLGWTLPPKLCLSEHFEQEKFYAKVSGVEEGLDVSGMLTEQHEEPLMMMDEHEEDNLKEKEENKGIKMKLLNDKPSSYSYLPLKSQEKMVLYGSEHLYTLCRFIYALYERLIRMNEVAQTVQKVELFRVLLCACVKAKQSSKFQQNLNLLFGKHAYLFSTVYKLLDNLIKSLSNVSGCALTNYSFKCQRQESEDLYFVLLNRFCLASNLTNSRISRLTYHKENKLIYFNYLNSYYKAEDPSKDIPKKRAEISKGIEIYTIDSFGLEKKKRKFNQVSMDNQSEYIFEGSTIKMINHAEHEDLMQFVGKKTPFSKTAKRELKRAHKMLIKSS